MPFHLLFLQIDFDSRNQIVRVVSEKRKKEKKIYSLSLLNRINMIVKLNVNSVNSVKTSEMFISGPNCRCWAGIKPRGTRFNSLKLFVFTKRKEKGSYMFIQTNLIPFIKSRSISNAILKLHEILYFFIKQIRIKHEC